MGRESRKREAETCKLRKQTNRGWDFRVIEIIIREIKSPEMNKIEKATAGVDRTTETTAAEMKADDVTSLPVALNTIPSAAMPAASFSLIFKFMGFPCCKFGISRKD